MNQDQKSRLRASMIHLAASAAFFLCVTIFMYAFWYRGPLFDLDGGRAFVKIALPVDVILGPALTLIIWNTKKPLRELLRDVSIIALLQISALTYGTYLMWNERPQFLVMLDGVLHPVPKSAMFKEPVDPVVVEERMALGIPLVFQSVPAGKVLILETVVHDTPPYAFAEWWSPMEDRHLTKEYVASSGLKIPDVSVFGVRDCEKERRCTVFPLEMRYGKGFLLLDESLAFKGFLKTDDDFNVSRK